MKKTRHVLAVGLDVKSSVVTIQIVHVVGRIVLLIASRGLPHAPVPAKIVKSLITIPVLRERPANVMRKAVPLNAALEGIARVLLKNAQLSVLLKLHAIVRGLIVVFFVLKEVHAPVKEKTV